MIWPLLNIYRSATLSCRWQTDCEVKSNTRFMQKHVTGIVQYTRTSNAYWSFHTSRFLSLMFKDNFLTRHYTFAGGGWVGKKDKKTLWTTSITFDSPYRDVSLVWQMQYQTCSVFSSRFQQFLSILIVYCEIHDRQCLCYTHLVWDSFRNEDESETLQKNYCG